MIQKSLACYKITGPNVHSQSQEAEATKEGNGWIVPVLKGLTRSSPTGLKITLRSVMEFPRTSSFSS